MFGWLKPTSEEKPRRPQPVIDEPDPNARWEGRYRIVEYTHRSGEKTFKIEVWVSGAWYFAADQEYAPLHWVSKKLESAEKECDYRYGREIVKSEKLKSLPIIEAESKTAVAP